MLVACRRFSCAFFLFAVTRLLINLRSCPTTPWVRLEPKNTTPLVVSPLDGVRRNYEWHNSCFGTTYVYFTQVKAFKSCLFYGLNFFYRLENRINFYSGIEFTQNFSPFDLICLCATAEAGRQRQLLSLRIVFSAGVTSSWCYFICSIFESNYFPPSVFKAPGIGSLITSTGSTPALGSNIVWSRSRESSTKNFWSTHKGEALASAPARKARRKIFGAGALQKWSTPVLERSGAIHFWLIFQLWSAPEPRITPLTAKFYHFQLNFVPDGSGALQAPTLLHSLRDA
ncbi:hypothetical protein ACFE04_000075 [Oxalis oulophora]